MDVFQLQARLGLNTEEYERALRNAVSQAQQMQQGLNTVSQTSNNATNAINATGQAAQDTANATGNAADATNNLTQSLTDSTTSADDAGRAFQDAAGKIKGDLAGAAKIAGAAFAATSAAVIGATKQAVDQFAQYEQLVGGVDTLFKDSSQKVQQYAEQAYKTAGLSANAYMETVTSFSASLLQGLEGDTAKAADVADLAIRDMSDNANKMGTAMESIQNAYQGFSKQNFMMLDNLNTMGALAA